MDLTSSTDFPRLPEATMTQLLESPDASKGRLRVVIDTDLDNEIDDFFALVHLLLAHDAGHIEVEAIYAAPFSFRSRLDSMLQAEALMELPQGERSTQEQALVDAYKGQIGNIRKLGWDPRQWDYPPEGAPDPTDPDQYDQVAVGPRTGMERSYVEALKLVELVGIEVPVFKGADAYLSNGCPVRSEAVVDLIARARAGSTADPLYVMGLACATNLASALLIAPDIRDKVVMTWTAGYPTNVTDLVNTSFNLSQDVPAAQVLFSSGVPLVYLPGFYIGQMLSLSQPDVERWFQATGPIGEALAQRYLNNPLFLWYGVDKDKLEGRIWNIWDLINGAWLLDPGSVSPRKVRAPRLSDERYWVPDPEGHWMVDCTYTSYNAIFPDFVRRLAAYDGPRGSDC